MTITQRRSKGDDSGTLGVKYTCDSCNVDITATVRIKCAEPECDEVDLCPNCFSEGKEIQKHKAWHDYKVVEKHSKPIFNEDWGADEELLLITGLQTYGLGNWVDVAEHLGTRTKEECEKHYLDVYVGERPRGEGKKDFMPRMKTKINITQEEFSARKKARIEELRKPKPIPQGALVAQSSQPSNHEIGGFMPGRLEFDHEYENDAENVIKDMEFGLVMAYGGGDQPEPPDPGPSSALPIDGSLPPTDAVDPPAVESETVVKMEEEPTPTLTVKSAYGKQPGSKTPAAVYSDAMDVDDKPKVKAKGNDSDDDEGPPPQKIIMELEDDEDLELKLAMLEIYYEKLAARTAVKDLIFDRGLLEVKKNAAADKKRPKEERDIIQLHRVFAKMQTAEDFEVYIDGLVYEQTLRKRIAELQEYRRLGITTAEDVARYLAGKEQRGTAYKQQQPIPRLGMTNSDRQLQRGVGGRYIAAGASTLDPSSKRQHLNDGGSHVTDLTSRQGVAAAIRLAAPEDLAHASALNLLSNEEKTLCSDLKILPQPYLVMKDTLIRENARRGGMLSVKDAKKLFKIDGNKTHAIFKHLINTGMMFRQRPPEADPKPLVPSVNGTPSKPAIGPPLPGSTPSFTNGSNIEHALTPNADTIPNGHA